MIKHDLISTTLETWNNTIILVLLIIYISLFYIIKFTSRELTTFTYKLEVEQIQWNYSDILIKLKK